MPHNRTRMWVGLAIVGVTIPAVGTYYAFGKPEEPREAPIRVAGRIDATNDIVTPRLSQPSRDYRAALEAALARSGPRLPAEALPGSDDDPNFDLDPYGETTDDEEAYVPNDPPDPATDLAPSNPTVPATSDEVPASVATTTEAPDPTADVAATGEMSDRDVYTVVTSNLNADDRDEFVRAYAAMTPAERADLLDGFRQQIQDNGP